MTIKTSDLSFKYFKNSKNIIDTINLQINKNKVNIILGLNGSGKTTLIKLLAGIYKPTYGQVLYDDKNLANIKIKNRCKIFSYVPQKISVDSDILVKDYLSYGLLNTINLFKSPKKEDFDKVIEISQKLNIEYLLDKKIGQLSGGEKQLCALASAFLQNTDVIILDEPTSALDIKNQVIFLRYLKKLSENKTIIMSSHNPNHALYLDSYCYILKDNKLYKEGPSNNIIKPELLSEIYGDSICLSKNLDYDEISFK